MYGYAVTRITIADVMPDFRFRINADMMPDFRFCVNADNEGGYLLRLPSFFPSLELGGRLGFADRDSGSSQMECGVVKLVLVCSMKLG